MKKRYDWSKQRIESALSGADSYSDTLRRLGVVLHGRNADTLKRKMKEYCIPTPEFPRKANKLFSKTYNGD